MRYLFNSDFKKIKITEYGFILFLLGIFFLPSTTAIGILLILPSLIIGSFLNKKYFKDSWNYPFLIFGSLILLSSFLQNFFFKINHDGLWDPKLSFIGLGNWLPFIWLFWAIQPYLNSKSKRRTFGIVLIAGTFPVLVTGFGQYFLNWTGPFETLNGLIIWYQRPIEKPGGLSGLFSNQNYAASWLNFVWPFCWAVFLEKGNNFFKKTFAYGFLISTGFSAFLTFSRNAWLGLLTSIPIVTGKKGIVFLLPILLFSILFLIFLFSPIITSDYQDGLKNLLPEKIIREFSEEGYRGLDVTRLEIYKSATNVIIKNPFFGTGAASFSEIFLLEKNFWKGHSHNLLFELSISYGLPSAILFFLTITNIIYLSSIEIFIRNKSLSISYFDRAFWAALFFFLISQLTDIQYFDGKISIIAWVLIAGLKNIIEEKNGESVNIEEHIEIQ